VRESAQDHYFRANEWQHVAKVRLKLGKPIHATPPATVDCSTEVSLVLKYSSQIVRGHS
jgi:hypothetical protein